MDYQLDKILEETIEKREERHQEMAHYVRKWAIKNGFQLFAQKGYESPTVTCIKNNKNLNIAALIEKIKDKHNMVFSNGYRDLREKTFRIGHLGDVTLEEIKEFLDVFEKEAN
jgi:aspartate aminotransferase-like enzyme